VRKYIIVFLILYIIFYVTHLYIIITNTYSYKLDCSVCTSITELYDGRDVYRIYYIENNYTFRHFILAIFRLIN